MLPHLAHPHAKMHLRIRTLTLTVYGNDYCLEYIEDFHVKTRKKMPALARRIALAVYSCQLLRRRASGTAALTVR